MLSAGAIGPAVDVRDAEACAQIVRAGVELGGRIGVWVNNAGVLATEPAWQTSAETRRLIMEVNALGTMIRSLAALESMHASGGGHIINIASMAALVAVKGEAVYAASKHASIGFTLSLAADLQIAGRTDVKLSAICRIARTDIDANGTGIALVVEHHGQVIGDLSCWAVDDTCPTAGTPRS